MFEDEQIEFVKALSSARSRGVFLGVEVVVKMYSEVSSEVFQYAHPNLTLILGRTTEGRVLTEWLPKSAELDNKLGPQTVLKIMIGLCAGIEYLTRQGVTSISKPLDIDDILLSDTYDAKIKESVFITGTQTKGQYSLNDLEALGKILQKLLSVVSGEKKNGLLIRLRDLCNKLSSNPSSFTFSSLYKTLRTIGKHNKPDETEALTPFLLGQ